MLDVFVEAWPDALDKETVAERTGYSPSASTIGVALSKLRALGLVEGWQASDEFMDAIS